MALGGEPTTQAQPVPVAVPNREMVEQVLETGQQVAKEYMEQAKQAEDLRERAGLFSSKT